MVINGLILFLLVLLYVLIGIDQFLLSFLYKKINKVQKKFLLFLTCVQKTEDSYLEQKNVDKIVLGKNWLIKRNQLELIRENNRLKHVRMISFGLIILIATQNQNQKLLLKIKGLLFDLLYLINRPNINLLTNIDNLDIFQSFLITKKIH